MSMSWPLPDRFTTEHGDPAARANTILLAEAGSTAHGMSTGADDLDLLGVYIEHPDQVLGIAASKESFIARTASEGERSHAGDIDLTLYGLRKFLRLATAGNPTVLIALYSERYDATYLGEELRALAPAIVSRRAGHRFLGYLDGQLERMRGKGRQSRVPNRPELVERHGFDTKYAAHAVRLGLQGIELLDTGRLSIPMQQDNRELVLAVRGGEYTQGEVDDMATGIRGMLAAAVNNTDGGPLRQEPDLDAVNEFAAKVHNQHWMTTFYRPRYALGFPTDA